MPSVPRVDGYLLDTNVTSALWDAGDRDHDEYRRRVQALGTDDELYASVVTFGEVEYGLHKRACTLDAAQQRALRAAMRAHRLWLDVTHHVATDYGRLRAAVFNHFVPKDPKKKAKWLEQLVDPEGGQAVGVQEGDLWIVATAVTHNLRLVSSDQMNSIKAVFNDAFPEHDLAYVFVDWRTPAVGESGGGGTDAGGETQPSTPPSPPAAAEPA